MKENVFSLREYSNTFALRTNLNNGKDLPLKQDAITLEHYFIN